MSLSELIVDYLTFCKYRREYEKNGKVDLSEVKNIHPTTILPMACVVDVNSVALPKDQVALKYVLAILNKSSELVDDVLPLVELPKNKDESDEIMQKMLSLGKNDVFIGGTNALGLLIGEFETNIYEHSHFTHAWVMGYRYKTHTEICFFDNGITIAGSLAKAGLQFDGDKDALQQATTGTSSKISKERGFGLQHSINLVKNGLNGELLIISGKAGAFLSQTATESLDLDGETELKGTLVSVKIPIQHQKVDIYDVIK